MLKTHYYIIGLLLCLITATPATAEDPHPSPVADTCLGQSPGDANSDGTVDIADSRYLISYLCQSMPAPDPLSNGDANGDCLIDSLDVAYIVSFIFQGGPAPVECTCIEPVVGDCWSDSCDFQYPGDANSDGFIDISDSKYLTNYLCLEGPAPNPLPNGDANGDCIIDSSDVDYMIEYIFQGGPAPVDCTCLLPAKGDCWGDTCTYQYPGDANGNYVIEIADAVYIEQYHCFDGPPPNVPANGDPNGDCIIDTDDVDYLIDHLIHGGPAPVDCTCLNPEKGDCVIDSCTGQFPGDANGDGFIDIADARYLVNFICLGGEPPEPMANGDPNGDCLIDSLDVDHIIGYIFQGGETPVNCTCEEPVVGECWVDTCKVQYPADANGSGEIDVADAVYLGQYLCFDGPAPNPLANGDPNGDCVIDSLDLEYIISYIFKGGPAPVDCTCLFPVKGPCPQYNCGGRMAGEANGDEAFNVGDAVYLVGYIFKGGPYPYPYSLYSGDANCDCQVNIGDVVWAINYVFKSGPPPCSCEEWLGNCGPPLR
ncbi:MAG: hypothetical protein GY841_15160 [FCB group bacterium]|nr:hypothetical protein [FCB group bacterium]